MRPPCVNKSELGDVGRNRIIQLGLYHLKGLTKKLQSRIVEERKKDGQFEELESFLSSRLRALVKQKLSLKQGR